MPTKTLKRLYADLRRLNKLSKNRFGGTSVKTSSKKSGVKGGVSKNKAPQQPPPNPNCDIIIRDIQQTFLRMGINGIGLRRNNFDSELSQEDFATNGQTYQQLLHAMYNVLRQQGCLDYLKSHLLANTRLLALRGEINVIQNLSNNDALWVIYRVLNPRAQTARSGVLLIN